MNIVPPVGSLVVVAEPGYQDESYGYLGHEGRVTSCKKIDGHGIPRVKVTFQDGSFFDYPIRVLEFSGSELLKEVDYIEIPRTVLEQEEKSAKDK